MEDCPGEKCEKVTLKTEKEALEQPQQSRTVPNLNWVECGHRNERGRKETYLSSKQALPRKKKTKKRLDPGSANYPKDNYSKKYKRAAWKMDQEKNVKRLYSEERKKPYITLNRTKQTTLYKNWVRNGDRKEKGKTTKTKNSNAKEPYESG